MDTTQPAGRLRSTTAQGATAVWYVHEGVVRVVSIVDADGRTTDLDGEHLGGCFDIMPRRLWERVRYEYETSRNNNKG